MGAGERKDERMVFRNKGELAYRSKRPWDGMFVERSRARHPCRTFLRTIGNEKSFLQYGLPSEIFWKAHFANGAYDSRPSIFGLHQCCMEKNWRCAGTR